MINLELDRRDAIVLRHHLFLYTKDHPGFFSDEGILKIREISQQIDKHLEEDGVTWYVDKNIFVVGCYNGSGIGVGTLYGEQIALKANNENTEEINIIEKRNKAKLLPPRPLLDIGVKVRLMYERFIAASEY